MYFESVLGHLQVQVCFEALWRLWSKIEFKEKKRICSCAERRVKIQCERRPMFPWDRR